MDAPTLDQLTSQELDNAVRATSALIEFAQHFRATQNATAVLAPDFTD